MPYANGKYTAPSWANGAEPPISAANLKDISDALQALTSFLYTGYVTSGQKAGTTLGVKATVEGYGNTATEIYSHAEGTNSDATGPVSHAEGSSNRATGSCSHAQGNWTTASNFASFSGGHLSKKMTDGGEQNNQVGDVMVLGNGTNTQNHSNCFRVTYAGSVYGLSSFKTSGADYAEYFEWEDGNPDNEDRVGYFVTLEGRHICKAAPGDYILGVVSGQPCIIGNADEDWLGRWQHDAFGRFIKEYLESEETQITPPEGMEEAELHAWMMDNQAEERDGKYFQTTERVVDYETPSWRYKANPEYDNTKPYIERRDRQEWDAVGMLGVLAVRDDGSCQPGGCCKAAEGGIATAAGAELEIIDGKIVKGYRVMERVTDNIVKIVFR